MERPIPIIRNIIDGDDKTPRFVDFYESEDEQRIDHNKILGVESFKARYEDWKKYPIKKGRF